MARLLIVHYSLTGGTRQMARAAANLAAAEGAEVRLLAADEAGATEMLAADGYIFATPETLAAIAGPMKGFFDRTYYPLLDRIVARPYAAFVCAGSDGRNAARQIARIATGWRLKPVADPLILCTHAQTPEAIMAAKTIAPAGLDRCGEIGATLAAGLMLGIF